MSSRASGAALENIYEDNLRALVQLQKIDVTLREVRFRHARLPYEGSDWVLRALRSAQMIGQSHLSFIA